MRNTKYLIKEAKQSTNTTDQEAITDALCIRYLNRAQDFIQSFLANQGLAKRVLRGTTEISVVSGTDTYALPHDIYGKNTVNSVMIKENNLYSPLTQIGEKGRSTTSGYFLSNGNIVLTPMPQTPFTLEVSYVKKAPAIGKSYGTIQSVVANTSLTLAVGYTDMEDVFDDYFSVVNFDGEVIRYGILIDQTAAVLTVSDTTDIVAGMYVVPGKYATTHCQLPDELEGSLVMALETMINARLSSTDIPVSKVFSDEMLSEIVSMFAENGTDTFQPPIVEYSEWA